MDASKSPTSELHGCAAGNQTACCVQIHLRALGLAVSSARPYGVAAAHAPLRLSPRPRNSKTDAKDPGLGREAFHVRDDRVAGPRDAEGSGDRVHPDQGALVSCSESTACSPVPSCLPHSCDWRTVCPMLSGVHRHCHLAHAAYARRFAGGGCVRVRHHALGDLLPPRALQRPGAYRRCARTHHHHTTLVAALRSLLLQRG